MSPVHTAQFSDPAIAVKLQEHSAERDRLLQRLTSLFRKDERIRASWLWGSFSRGEQDDLSDLDLWLLADDAAIQSLGYALREMCAAAGTVVAAEENPQNGPPGGSYLGILMAGTYGLHHVDLYWQPASQEPKESGLLLFDRRREPFTSRPSHAEAGRISDECGGRFSFVWLMLSVVAKYLARDPDSDMALLSYPRQALEEIAQRVDRPDLFEKIEWGVPTDPAAKVVLLRRILRAVVEIESAYRNTGHEISPQAIPCLTKYVELVDQIVRVRTEKVGRLQS